MITLRVSPDLITLRRKCLTGSTGSQKHNTCGGLAVHILLAILVYSVTPDVWSGLSLIHFLSPLTFPPNSG